MTPDQYDKVSSVISGYGRQLPEWEELREADQETLGALRLEAPSTVTVITTTGADVLAADAWQRTGQSADELSVLLGGKLVAEYRPAYWKSVVVDAHRSPSGPGREPEEHAEDGK